MTDYVQSPTFTLVSEHEGQTGDGRQIRLYHLDLYRLAGEDDLDDIGLDDLLSPMDGVTVVEWPERAADWLPPAYLLVRFESLGADERRITIEAVPAVGSYAAHVGALRARWDG